MATFKNTDLEVFHEGEKEIQRLVGVRQDMSLWGPRAIRTFSPEQHRTFYCQLPFIVFSARDSNGAPWISLLTDNKPYSEDSKYSSFISSPTNTQLHFATSVIKGDALEHSITEGAEMGLIGIELHSRRRNRVNGVVSKVSENSISFDVTQDFGNCPQYISERILKPINVDPDIVDVSHHQCLTASMQDWINKADTLFIGSGYQRPLNDETADISNGMDASHRGGSPGFIRILNDRELVLPDYAGNNFFNTIGNLVKDPGVGLLFIDFDTGSMLQMTGQATIDWGSYKVREHAGAHRLINIKIDKIVQLLNVLPLRWSLPNSIESGLKVIRKTKESDDVTSFELAAAELFQQLPNFKPGQHLPIQLSIDGNPPVERTYSLSNSPTDQHYRITVKKEDNGLVSQYLHHQVKVGDIIQAKHPNGDFLMKFPTRPVVLICAGVGVTPIASMLHSLVDMNIQSTVHVLYAARNSTQAPLLSELHSIGDSHPSIDLAVAFSQPNDKDIVGENHRKAGRINEQFIKDVVTDLNANFYICGPTPFINTVLSALEALGVEKQFTHFESF